MLEAVAVLIPARRDSSRLPEKLLLSESGKPLLQHTCEQAGRAFGRESVIVCADDEALCAVAREAGFRAEMTSADHQSGSDRIAEIAATLTQPICVNVQADEPEIDPAHIQLVASLLEAHSWARMATLGTPGTIDDQHDPNAVKVSIGAGQRALTFTRGPCPWDRDAGAPAASCFRHLGLYAYRRDLLLSYKNLPESRLERIEKLEQLRAVEAGIGIACAVVEAAAPGIDVRSDYDAFLSRMNNQGAK